MDGRQNMDNWLIFGHSACFLETFAVELRMAGRTVNLATSEEEALRKVRDEPFSVMLVERDRDLNPGQFRSLVQARRPGCRVLFLSSFEQDRTAGTLLEHGVNEVILGMSDLAALADAPAGVAKPGADEAARRTGSLIQSLDVMVGLLESDDSYFGGFSHHVATLAQSIARELRLPDHAIEEIAIAVLLRDIGKCGVRGELLVAPSSYGDEELAAMREHVEWSVRLLEHIDFAWKVLPIIRHHHERYDGTGYPEGLKGRAIPLGARIIAAAEAYVAMVSERPHRPAKHPDKAIDDLMRHAGTQFDPEVIEAVMRVLAQGSPAGLLGQRSFVLVIDPETEFGRLLRMRLQNEGLEVRVVPAFDGDLAGLSEHPPALLLVDAGEDGSAAFELLARIRAADRSAEFPIALLARKDDRFLRLAALRQGVDDFIPKHGDLEEIVARVENILTREEMRRRRAEPRRCAGIRGRVEDFPLPDVIQMLTSGGKTACVSLSGDGREGKVWLRDGIIVHAECGVLRGEQAFYDMVSWPRGEFLINHGVQPPERTIQIEPTLLLMEAMVRMDEGVRSERDSGAEPVEFDLKI